MDTLIAPVDGNTRPVFRPAKSKRKSQRCRVKYITTLFRSCIKSLESETYDIKLRHLSSKTERGIPLSALTSGLIKDLSNVYITRGDKAYVERSKLLRTWIFQFASRSQILIDPKDSIRCRNGIPVPLYSIVRRYLVDKDPRILIWTLNLLICSRDILGKGELNEAQIQQLAVRSPESESYFSKKWLRRKLRLSASHLVPKKYYNRSRNLDKLAVSSFASYSSGPNSYKKEVRKLVQIYPPIHESVKVRQNALDCAELDAYALYSNTELFELWEKWCLLTDQKILLSFFYESLPSVPPSVSKALVVNRPGAKADIELKNRLYSICNFWVNTSLEGLHRLGYEILDNISVNYFKSHDDAFRALVKQQNNGRRWMSFDDEERASDLFVLEAYCDVMVEFLPPQVVQTWYKLIKSLPFSSPFGDFTYGSGSQMGSKGSWPWWNITENSVDLIRNRNEPLARVGDDSGMRLETAEWQIPFRVKHFGCRYNQYKGLRSKIGVEMCKQYFIRGSEVTPVPMKLRFAARKDVGAFGCLISRLSKSNRDNLLRCLPKILTLYSQKKSKNGPPRPNKRKETELFYAAFIALFPTDPYVLKVKKLAVLKSLLAELEKATAWVPKEESRSLSSRFFEANRARTVKDIRQLLIRYLADGFVLASDEDVLRILRHCPRIYDRIDDGDKLIRFYRLSTKVLDTEDKVDNKSTSCESKILDLVGYLG